MLNELFAREILETSIAHPEQYVVIPVLFSDK